MFVFQNNQSINSSEVLFTVQDMIKAFVSYVSISRRSNKLSAFWNYRIAILHTFITFKILNQEIGEPYLNFSSNLFIFCGQSKASHGTWYISLCFQNNFVV